MSVQEDLAADRKPGDAPSPRTWLVLSDKLGDNAQVETVEKALSWPCERKFIRMREPYVLGKPRVKASLHHVDLSQSDPLEPPWPDLIITIGRRPSMVALWIHEQSKGHTRIVLLGKPSGGLEPYDLVIASGEIQLPPLPNVLPITLPLMRASESAVADAVGGWRPRLADLPRPLVAILIGGPTGPFVFDASVAERLVQVATEVVTDMGGTPYLTTSRRTPSALVDALRAGLPAGAQLFQWTPGAIENPYLALLGLADGIMVTGDSISMMVEVAQLRRPLAIFPLPVGRLGALDQVWRTLSRRLFAPAGNSLGGRIRQGLARTLYRARLMTQTRDFTALHRQLIERGMAVPAGSPFQPPRGQFPDDLALVVARIRGVME